MEAEITVGIDFGTHQTKVCIGADYGDGRGSSFRFMKFKDRSGIEQFTLPSLIQINKDHTLSYGFVDDSNCSTYKKSSQEPQKPMVSPEPDSLPEKPRLKKIPEEPKLYKEFGDWRDQLQALTKAKNPLYIAWQKEVQAVKARNEALLARWNADCDRLRDEAHQRYEKQMEAYQKEHDKWKALNEAGHKAVFRYFKQAFFADLPWEDKPIGSALLSVWYLSFILFDLEEEYGKSFSVQIGIPTGSETLKRHQVEATQLLLTAYRLVEDVFENDKNAFLSTDYEELTRLTEFVTYTEDKKQEYGILVFPEAYANLLVLTEHRRLSEGLTLLIDIGGGTTDMSYFTTYSKNGETQPPHIFSYDSIPKGLNFVLQLAGADIETHEVNPGAIKATLDSSHSAVDNYCDIVAKKFTYLRQGIYDSYKRTGRNVHYLNEAVIGRPVVYSGGGSTFKVFKRSIYPYTEVYSIDAEYWRDYQVEDISAIMSRNLIPILNTALGLAITKTDDDIKISQVSDLFKTLKIDKVEDYGYDHTIADVN